MEKRFEKESHQISGSLEMWKLCLTITKSRAEIFGTGMLNLIHISELCNSHAVKLTKEAKLKAAKIIYDYLLLQHEGLRHMQNSSILINAIIYQQFRQWKLKKKKKQVKEKRKLAEMQKQTSVAISEKVSSELNTQLPEEFSNVLMFCISSEDGASFLR